VHSQLPAIDALPDSGCATTPATGKRRFDVGPGQTFSELTQVPWLSLRGGDVVNIHYRPEPYRTKLLISAQASARAPIVVNGVTDAQCRRPVITGENAVPSDDAARRGAYNQWTEALATILLWGPWGQKPRFIEIRNLAITGARAGVEFRKQDGGTGRFGAGSSGIHGAAVEDILIENCEISGNGNGIFVNTKNDSEQETSYRITMRRNLLHNNGNVGRWFEHNLYVQAVRPLYEGNYLGQLIPGAVGSSLKDRSSGTIMLQHDHCGGASGGNRGGSTTVFAIPRITTPGCTATSSSVTTPAKPWRRQADPLGRGQHEIFFATGRCTSTTTPSSPVAIRPEVPGACTSSTAGAEGRVARQRVLTQRFNTAAARQRRHPGLRRQQLDQPRLAAGPRSRQRHRDDEERATHRGRRAGVRRRFCSRSRLPAPGPGRCAATGARQPLDRRTDHGTGCPGTATDGWRGTGSRAIERP
jgi:hypothetical protein